MFSVARFVRVCCLYLIRSICVWCTLMNCLLCLRFLWLALFVSALLWWVVCFICVFCGLFSQHLLSIPSPSAIPWWVVYSICVFCSLFHLHLLSIPRLFCLCLLCLGQLSAPSASSVTCSIRICCLYLIWFICGCCALVSCLFHLHLPWLVPSVSAVYTSFTPSAFSFSSFLL